MQNGCRGFFASNTIVPFPLPPFLLLLLRSEADLQGSSSRSRQAASQAQLVQIQADLRQSVMMTPAPANPLAIIALSTPHMAFTNPGIPSQACGRIPEIPFPLANLGSIPALIMIITIIIHTLAHLTAHMEGQMGILDKGQMKGFRVIPMMVHMGPTAVPMALMAGHMGGHMAPTRAPHSTRRTCISTPQRSQHF